MSPDVLVSSSKYDIGIDDTLIEVLLDSLGSILFSELSFFSLVSDFGFFFQGVRLVGSKLADTCWMLWLSFMGISCPGVEDKFSVLDSV